MTSIGFMFSHISLVWKWWEDKITFLPLFLVPTVEQIVGTEDHNDRNIVPKVFQFDST